mgnify:FL=1
MKTILLVEDDAALRECYETSLTLRGYRVTVARDGLEALQLYVADTFDFILTDYQMPRWNGEELLLDIRFLNPTQKMILMSGDPPVLRAELSGVPVLEKPFQIEELVKILEGE